MRKSNEHGIKQIVPGIAVEEVYEAFDLMEKPTGQSIFIPKYEKGEEKGKYVSDLDHQQQLMLGQILSKQAFPGGDSRYTLLSAQRSYDMIYSGTNEGEAFKKLNVGNWFWNRELILPEDMMAVMPDPRVYVIDVESKYDHRFKYEGETVNIKMRHTDTIKTLAEANLFKESDHNVWNSNVRFEDCGSAVCSNFIMKDGMEHFHPFQQRIGARSYDGLVAFEKVPKVAQEETDQFKEIVQKSRDSVKSMKM